MSTRFIQWFSTKLTDEWSALQIIRQPWRDTRFCRPLGGEPSSCFCASNGVALQSTGRTGEQSTAANGVITFSVSDGGHFLPDKPTIIPTKLVPKLEHAMEEYNFYHSIYTLTHTLTGEYKKPEGGEWWNSNRPATSAYAPSVPKLGLVAKTLEDPGEAAVGSLCLLSDDRKGYPPTIALVSCCLVEKDGEGAERRLYSTDGGAGYKYCTVIPAVYLCALAAAQEEYAELVHSVGVQESEVCPKCGRKKARSADDISAGFCPVWYATHDDAAETDCVLHRTPSV